MTDEDTPADSAPEADPAVDPIEYRTLAHGYLSPRQRRLCQLLAEGQSAARIGEEIGYVPSRISVLKRHPLIAEEIQRLQEKIFEDTIGNRMKAFADQALTNIGKILNDNSGRVKTHEKMALSQWVVEKLDGKAAQKIEAGENLLAVLMDRLDARRTDSRPAAQPADIDVTPRIAEPTPHPDQVEPVKPPVDDDLAAWIAEFASTTPSGE